MLDHLGFAVADFPRSRGFYAAALAPLGMAVHSEGNGWAMFGPAGRPLLWIGGPDVAGRPPGHIHYAFAAADRESVNAFHAAALTAGGHDNGGPGIRPQYHANYYAAFVIDPDGHNIEAVCHAPGAPEDQT
ncbi:VOC family protein [Falsiroseomonas oryzae]|uniref:VOC family protein n=1 Tax=Falsiroseomonas oryzae TaxID=2766473 RepID=UPI0022EA5FD6|nr:VOC family protein [Roseomonas sp. MO-31]